MTTAHRPTWKAAYGLNDSVNKGYVPTRAYSARDMPGYLNLKQRKPGQGSVAELKQKDFKAELLQREQEIKRKKNGDILLQTLPQIKQSEHQPKRSAYDGDIDFVNQFDKSTSKRIKRPDYHDEDAPLDDIGENPFPEDQDSQQFIREDEKEEQHKKRVPSEDEDEDDDDDSQELLQEYKKIKQQREKEQLHKVVQMVIQREQKHRQSMANREAELLKGNPLINSSYSLSKRWYEDTVFRNQAKKVQEKKSYVNDFVRSEFHRKFMNRFMVR